MVGALPTVRGLRWVCTKDTYALSQESEGESEVESEDEDESGDES